MRDQASSSSASLNDDYKVSRLLIEAKLMQLVILVGGSV